MSIAKLTINLTAIKSNWRALDIKSRAETSAVVKANGYGLDASRVAAALFEVGGQYRRNM